MQHNMSAYQRFIDSSSQKSESSSSVGTNHSHIRKHPPPHSPSAKSVVNNMIRHQTQYLTNLPAHQLSSANEYVSSTPISKQQYKRLVELAEHQAINEQQRQQQQQHLYQPAPCQHQQRRYCHDCQSCSSPVHQRPLIKTDDPVLVKWLQAMRFETALECLTYMQARTLTIDEHSANALSVRNSQVAVQEMRAESNFILDFIDYLIGALPLRANKITKFFIEFSELWTRLMNQTTARTASNQNNQVTSNNKQNNLTIFNCTPRKSQATVRAQRPLDKLALKIRNLCIEYANLLYHYQERATAVNIDNDYLESSLRKLKELYGSFIEISIRFECANIVRALNYDFSQASLNRLSSTSSLLPARPFESSSSQLPLKWALIALWQLTNGDSDICRTLTERWQTMDSTEGGTHSPPSTRVAKRLDYSTKYDDTTAVQTSRSDSRRDDQCFRQIESDYRELYQICQPNRENLGNRAQAAGALSSALKNKQQPVKQMSTIEMLIDIIISQPNKHERLDMTTLIHHQAQSGKLIDLDEWDESLTAAIYTSNQYKVAALRILNHLCVNEQAVKTILKCFSTPPPSQGQPIPENKIIRSIFECYQTSQEHIYQNETMFHPTVYGNGAQRGRKRNRQVQQLEESEEYSDYGSRNTKTASQVTSDESDEGDDAVVKEAISLLVRLTNSFQQRKGMDFYTLIGRFSIDSLVRYLTSIIRSSTSREMISLSLNAIANISFITTGPMKMSGTNRVMLEMFRSSKDRSKDLELRDQAVTILTNTVDKNLLDIVSNGGLTFLLSCLESCPIRMANYKQVMRKDALEAEDEFQRLNIENKPRDRKPIDLREDLPDFLDCSCDQQPQSQSPIYNVDQCYSSNFQMQPTSLCLKRLTPNEVAAMERIHQKAAIAFGRMSVDAVTTKMVLKYGGVKQMIDLCKFSHKRNHSEIILRACIETLRKIADIIGAETFKYYNALDLIELEMKQALEIYGSFKTKSSASTTKLYISDV